jgi:hypothetical protein
VEAKRFSEYGPGGPEFSLAQLNHLADWSIMTED